MLFVLVLGAMLGGAAVVLVGQWCHAALDVGTTPGAARGGGAAQRSHLPRPTLAEGPVARLGGLVFVPSRRRG